MGEIKSVKVDNWGVFFLQKLQNFFNKTDYCDLTLQFNDNSQLKVHRLVLSACTDYFNVLEATCEMIDDVLVMPKDLQADVVVPIVNFMYTGTLEFEYKMYDRLLRTAREMNMTVLLKLLEAHRKTIPPKNLPVLLNKQVGVRNANVRTFPSYQSVERHVPQKIERTYTSPAQRKYTSPQKPQHIKSAVTTSYIPKTNIPETVAIVSKYRHLDNKTGPSRFDSCNEEVIPDSFESFNPISYESKPLITADQIKEEYEYERPSSSFEPFEQLRKGYTNPNKRAAVTGRLSDGPSSKKLNLQDVKEYTEAHRLRKQLEAEECEDDGMDYEQQEESFEEEITIKQENVKETPGSVHHAKIISEVLKKYPHLVKKNKNLKLKISPKTSPETKQPESKIQQVVVQQSQKQPIIVTRPVVVAKPRVRTIDSKTMHSLIAKGALNTTGPWLCLRCGVSGRPISIPSYKSFRRHLINVHHEKIDPRLCEFCGFKSAKRLQQIHHLFTEHKVKPPGELVFPKCSDCSHIAMDKSGLATHIEEEHSVKIKKEIQHCIYCNKVFAKEIALYAHMRSAHKERAREDGVMDFSDEEQSFDEAGYIPNHMESNDNKIKILSNISLPTKGMSFVVDTQNVSQIGGKTIVNLEPSSEAEAFSNVASGIATSLGLVVDDSQYHTETHILPTEYIEEAMADVHGEFIKKQQQQESSSSNDQMVTKVITGDGKELQLTAQQKEEIFSQLQDQSSDMTNNVVMVLNNDSFEEDHSQIISTDPNILVVYSQANEITKTTFIDSSNSIVEPTEKIEDSEIVDAIKEVEMSTNEATTKDESIDFEEKLDELLEENIEAKEQDEEEEAKEEEAEEEEEEITEESSDKKNDADKLISALEGDWSDDEEEEAELKKEEKEVEKVTEKEEVETEEVKEEENKEIEESKETEKEEIEETVPDKDDEKKELPNIMEDWIESESQKSFSEELSNTKEIDESTSTNKVDDKKNDSTELKTLINDWGDDDDDL